MFKNFTLIVAIATLVTSLTTFGYNSSVSAEPPARPTNQVKGTSPQEQALLDALSKTPGYTPSVGRYVQEFKRVHTGNMTQQQHQTAQNQLVAKYPAEAKFFQAFLQKVANLKQQQKTQQILQAIQKDGKMTTKFKQFMNELNTSIRGSKTLAEAKANQERVVNKYPAEAKVVKDYSIKFR